MPARRAMRSTLSVAYGAPSARRSSIAARTATSIAWRFSVGDSGRRDRVCTFIHAQSNPPRCVMRREPLPLRPMRVPKLAAAEAFATFVAALVLGFGAPAARASQIPPQAGASQAAPGVEVGIADQKVDMFSDPRFSMLGITRARLAIGWDALTKPGDVAELDAWLQGAQAAGVEPLISFMHSRSQRRSLPTPERLKYEFRRFRQLWPWVTTFATWNEANHCGEPLCHRPQLAAAYYRALRRECPSCTILAPEVLDMPNMRTWVRAFNRKLGYSPK